MKKQKDTSCIDAHVCIERILVNLVDGLRVVGLAADASVVHDTPILSVLRHNECQSDLHIELAIRLHRLRDKGLPAFGLTNIDFYEDGFTALLDNPLMGRNFFPLAKRSEVIAHEKGTFHGELMANLPTNALGRAGNYRNAILQTLTGHIRM